MDEITKAYDEERRNLYFAYTDMLYNMFKDEVHGGKRVLNLMIEPAFWSRKRIFFRLYRNESAEMVLLWDCISRDELSDCVVSFQKSRAIPDNITPEEIVVSAEFSEYIRSLSSLYKAVLNSEQQELVNAVLAEDFPVDVTYPQVYDGFEFVLKIYDGKERAYTSCCYLPEEWRVMVPMINIFIDLANVRYQHHVH